MKFKYGLFAYDGNYPSGGFNDLKFAFNTFEESQREILNSKHIANYESIELVNFMNLDVKRLDFVYNFEDIIKNINDFIDHQND